MISFVSTLAPAGAAQADLAKVGPSPEAAVLEALAQAVSVLEVQGPEVRGLAVRVNAAQGPAADPVPASSGPNGRVVPSRNFGASSHGHSRQSSFTAELKTQAEPRFVLAALISGPARPSPTARR